MASPEELIPSLPDTLPEDFGEWDSEGSAAATAVASGEWETVHALSEAPKAFGQSADGDAATAVAKQQEDVSNGKSEAVPTAKTLSSREEWEAWIESHSFSETPKPFGKTARRDETPASPADKPRGSGSSSSAPSFANKQKDSSNGNGKPSSTPKPAQSGEWESWVASHSNGKAPKSNGRSAEPKATLPPAAEKPRFSGSAASAAVSASVLVAEPELTNEPGDRASSPVSSSLVSLGLGVSRATNAVPMAVGVATVVEADEIVHSPEPTATLRREADEALFKLYSSKEIEVEEEPKTGKKKWMIIGGVGAGAILIPLILIMTVFHHGTTPAAKPSVQTVPAPTDTQVEAPTPDPSASVPTTSSAPAATTEKQQAANSQNSQPAAAANSVKAPKTPTKMQTKMMGDQLNAPTQIPQDAERQAAENAPPPASFDSAGADGLGGSAANASVLNGHGQPVVKYVPPKPIAVSSGVATGMLIQSTPPVYPSIAKAARVGGTVVVHATISKNGTIKDLHVVSGPPMLQQAALDAVRSWRYRPYMLSNQPIEVETSVSVVFSLDK
jgi:TonB family protein